MGIVQRQSHTRLRLNFIALKYHLFQKHFCPSTACPVCDAHVELYTPQVLLLCVKNCLPPLHNCSKIDGIVLPIRKKIDWFLNGISHDDFDTNVVFFSASNHLVPCPTVSVNFCSFVYVLFDRRV